MRSLFVLALTALLFACGETTPQAQSPNAALPPLPDDPGALSGSGGGSTGTPRPVTSLRRAQVRETIASGLGVFLQNVSVEDWPVMRDGKFHGFKIKTINSAWGVDLKPGDVIVRVNGIVPEHPEEADAALRSLDKAASLKVDFERDGKARTLELPITD